MTLKQYKERNNLRWCDVARELDMYEWRLNRLRNGAVPNVGEIESLAKLNEGLILSYRD